MDDEHLPDRELEERGSRLDRRAGLVHVRLGLEEGELQIAQPDIGQPPAELALERASVTMGELVDHHPTHVVTVVRMLAARVAEPRDEEVHRGTVLSPPEEAHALLRVGLGALVGGLGRDLALGPLLAFLALGGLLGLL